MVVCSLNFPKPLTSHSYKLPRPTCADSVLAKAQRACTKGVYVRCGGKNPLANFYPYSPDLESESWDCSQLAVGSCHWQLLLGASTPWWTLPLPFPLVRNVQNKATQLFVQSYGLGLTICYYLSAWVQQHAPLTRKQFSKRHSGRKALHSITPTGPHERKSMNN